MSFSGTLSTIVLLGTLALSSHAATHFVDADASGADDGTTWTDAFVSLQDALTAASSGDEIWVMEGTYYPDEGTGQTNNDRTSSFALKAGVAIYGGFPTNSFTPVFSNRKPISNPTILSGDLDQNDTPDGSNNSGNAYHVLSADGAGITSTSILEGFVITGGHADAANPLDRGAGLRCSNSAAPTIEGCIFRGNKSNWGGALRNETSASPTVTNCLFKNNSAVNGGGAVSNGSPSASTYTNCVFFANQSGDTGGGARDAASTTSYINCTFHGNSAATTGGGLHNHFATITLTSSILWENTAAGNTTTQTASIGSSSVAIPTVSHSLVQNWTATDLADPTNSIDGTNAANHPHFLDSELGDLRLLPGSPGINTGSSSANLSLLDPYDNPRKTGTIDLGAFETQRIQYVKTGGDDSDLGDSWADAYQTLAKALSTANPGDYILVAAGTYYPDEIDGTDSDDRNDTFALTSPDHSSVAILGGYPAVGSDGRDPNANPTILSGDIDQNDNPDGSNNSGNAFHVLTATGAAVDNTTLLDGFTITAGNTDISLVANSGAGLLCTDNGNKSAAPSLRHCSFQGNHSANHGGAVYISTIASPSFTSCFFQDNSADSHGGAIYIPSSTSPSFTDCSFQSNSSESFGGAVYNASSPAYTRCSFRGNSSDLDGGAIYNTSSASSFTHCLFQDNYTSGSAGDGGAVSNNSSSPTFAHCAFQGNGANARGGAVHNDFSSSPPFTNCSFQGNRANSTGGAVSNYSSSSPSFANCILWNNTVNGSTSLPGSSIHNFSSSAPTFSYCLVQNWTTTDLGDLTNSLDGTDPANDPRFLNPVVGDLRLLPESSAIDVGDNSANTETTDLFGNSRIFNTTIDLGALEAQNFHYVKSTGNDANSGNSWVLAYDTIQKALSEANPGDIILVGSGRYYPDEGPGQTDNDRNSTFSLKSGVAILGSFPTNPIAGDVRNPDTSATTLTGDLDKNDHPDGINNKGGNAYSVILADDTDSRTLLDSFSIYAGNANGSGSSSIGGGLRCINGATPTLVDCVFRENAALDDGGAVHIDSASPSFTNCAFRDNTSGDNGGAILCYSASPTFTHCIFRNNFAADAGGAVLNDFESTPSYTNCIFRDNSADFGGALFNSISTFPTLTNCLFRNNTAIIDGGAANNNKLSNSAYTNCIFFANQSGGSGGAALDRSGTTSYLNCTFLGNVATTTGGALHNVFANTSLTNSIIWDNTAAGDTSTQSASLSSVNASTPTVSHCLVENWKGSQLGDTFNTLNGTDPANDPRFINPAIGDLRLMPGSPVIEIGDNFANSTTTDLAGTTRTFNSTIDLGAFESRSFLYVKTTGNDSNAGTSWANAFLTVQKPLSAATPGDLILVAAGTYYPDEINGTDTGTRSESFKLASGVAIVGGFPASPSPGDTHDPDTNPTTLSGDLDQNDNPDGSNNSGNAYHVVTADGANAFSSLEGFMITAGNADSTIPHDRGAGLHCFNKSSSVLAHCTFQGNTADDGGAVYNDYASPSFFNSIFEDNSANEYGGAVYNKSSVLRASCPLYLNCTFSENAASDDGGAVFNLSGNPFFTNCTFFDNSATGDGGAIYLNFTPPFLTNCIIWNNSAQGGSSTIPEASLSTFLGFTLVFNKSTISHCLVENWTASSLTLLPLNFLDGTDPANDPLFVDPLNGDLRLQNGSPVIDGGDNTANFANLDLDGNPRIIGPSIDLGAFENQDLTNILWLTDTDDDGIPWGVEQALGTNPSVSDPENPNNLTAPAFNNSGHAVLTFGVSSMATPGTIWILTRSTDLIDFSDEVFRYDGTTITEGTGITANIAAETCTLTDSAPPLPDAYYRFEAIYSPLATSLKGAAPRLARDFDLESPRLQEPKAF